MPRQSPLLPRHEQAAAAFMNYGPPDSGIQVVAALAELELEYAAIRKGAALLDQPQRATLQITGPDRIDFLNRMITQELKGLAPGQARRTFWLSRKGRIDADLTLIELGDRMLVDVDTHAAERAVKGLGDFIITEDVTIQDQSETWHRLALHGPAAPSVIESLAGSPPPDPDHAAALTIAGAPTVCFRHDVCGVPGLELVVPAAHALHVYDSLLALGPRVRPIGWHAFNIARIEGGTPLYNIDFGPDSLPHESGVLRDRVSFKKGCYLGQEVVARMESRGHSKRILVALRCDSPTTAPLDSPQPVSGSNIYVPPEPDSLGKVTSSTPSPLLSLAVLCFASIKPAHAAPGTRVEVEAEGGRISATIQPSLNFALGQK